jgi:hypothetical protein
MDHGFVQATGGPFGQPRSRERGRGPGVGASPSMARRRRGPWEREREEWNRIWCGVASLRPCPLSAQRCVSLWDWVGEGAGLAVGGVVATARACRWPGIKASYTIHGRCSRRSRAVLFRRENDKKKLLPPTRFTWPLYVF